MTDPTTNSPPPPPPAAPRPPTGSRSPGLAGVLSVLFPGLGHLYAGATGRGLALAAAFIATMQSVIHSDFEPGTLLIAGIWLFGIVDAIRITEQVVQARATGRTPEIGLDRHWALGLVVIGAVATLALIPGLSWVARLWPLALAWVGIQLLRKRPILPAFLHPKEPDAPAPPAAPAASEPDKPAEETNQ